MKFGIIASLILCFSMTSVMGQTIELTDEMKQMLDEKVQDGTYQSVVIGIVDENGTNYVTMGKTKEGGSDVGEHTIYEIGSISKVFTTTMLAQMVANKKVKLEDPVQKYFPMNVTMPTKNGKEIEMGQLADHTSGLPRLPENFNPRDPANPYADFSKDEMFDFLWTYNLPRKIGAEYEYSNLGVGLLGHVLAEISYKSYDDILQEMVAKPLGLEETKVDMDENMQANLAPGHSKGEIVPNWDIPTIPGAGAIKSSAHDILVFLSANLGLEKTDLLPALELTHEERHKKAGDMRVGLGWHIAKGTKGDIVWHNGGTGGYRSFAGFVKELNAGVVILTNSDVSVDEIGFSLLGAK